MKRFTLNTVALTALATGVIALPTAADEDAERKKLIALDKTWAETLDAAALEKMLDPRLVAIAPDGMADRAGLTATETAADAPMGPYQPGDYQVMFLDDDIAIMVHSASGEDSHYSMHVWEQEDDQWRVVATATTPKGK